MIFEARSQGTVSRQLPLCCRLGARFFAIGLLVAVTSPAAGERCIVIDTDAALDDYRAVATLAHSGEIATIVVTEGIARSYEGAGAMEAFLSRFSDRGLPLCDMQRKSYPRSIESLLREGRILMNLAESHRGSIAYTTSLRA
jgi:hypothetical protein